MRTSPTIDADQLDIPRPDATSDDRGLATAVHVATLAAQVLTGGLLHVVVPAVAFVLLKDKSAWLQQHIKEQLNFQVTYLVVAVLLGVLAAVTFGVGLFIALPLIVAYFIVNVVCSIKAALAATRGDAYRFPWSIRFFG